jgi:FMN phosphatase YigB (HAD superfamily)
VGDRPGEAVTGPRYCLLDFDDTLAVGPMTWGIEQFLPDLMARHGLTADADRLDAALLRAQESAAARFDESRILDDFLTDLGWPEPLRAELAAAARADFAFTLFPDTVPFLTSLRDRGIRIFVVSNNNRCPRIAGELGIADYIEAFFTPRMDPAYRPKPDRSLFDAVRAAVTDLGPENTVMVGDDPWSDGAFAAAVGLPCWIVDRRDRYGSLALAPHIVRVASLAQVLVAAPRAADRTPVAESPSGDGTSVTQSPSGDGTSVTQSPSGDDISVTQSPSGHTSVVAQRSATEAPVGPGRVEPGDPPAPRPDKVR